MAIRKQHPMLIGHVKDNLDENLCDHDFFILPQCMHSLLPLQITPIHPWNNKICPYTLKNQKNEN
jgi:hypothetical protein